MDCRLPNEKAASQAAATRPYTRSLAVPSRSGLSAYTMTEGAGTEERDDVAPLVTQPICEVLGAHFSDRRFLKGRLLNVLLQRDAASQTPESREEVLGLMELNAAMFSVPAVTPLFLSITSPLPLPLPPPPPPPFLPLPPMRMWAPSSWAWGRLHVGGPMVWEAQQAVAIVVTTITAAHPSLLVTASRRCGLLAAGYAQLPPCSWLIHGGRAGVVAGTVAPRYHQPMPSTSPQLHPLTMCKFRVDACGVASRLTRHVPHL
ncbi:hypothetical protein CPB84DRAFT_1853889 [Gymnopilus junonius]|uniref:Uncharacterized protein n=1 Tax=Gymnopilus junonius TaxID=109634 RepID=A0A9P5N855_GYMJU|nr:hypothetical protein CPB84DRAFT_1853889 [Gymnopilus junonius]